MSTQKTNKIVGYVSGVWNGSKFEIKKGTSRNGKKFAIAQIQVSEKDDNGNWTTGSPIKFVIFGDDADNVIEKQRITITGYFRPNNYQKDGKEVRGNEFAALTAKPTVEGDKTSLWGYVTGAWKAGQNGQNGSFQIITGVTQSGKRYTKAQLKVSQKNEDGTWTNGASIPFTIWGDVQIVDKQLIEFEGFFKPNNYEKNGKEIRGNYFLATQLIGDTPVPQQNESQPQEPDIQEPNDIQEPQEPEPVDPTEQPPSNENPNNQPKIEDEDENPFDD